MAEHDLMFDDSFYLDMAKHDYERNVQRWMGKESVLNKAASMPRSKKKLNELWKKGALQIGDTMTMKKTAGNGNDVFFSATVGIKSSVLRSGANAGCFNLSD